MIKKDPSHFPFIYYTLNRQYLSRFEFWALYSINIYLNLLMNTFCLVTGNFAVCSFDSGYFDPRNFAAQKFRRGEIRIAEYSPRGIFAAWKFYRVEIGPREVYAA